MDEKTAVASLEELFAAGDAWLRKYGVVSKVAHNSIVTNLYVNFPKVRYLEYFLPEDSSVHRKVWVRLYVPFWKLLLINREKMIDDVIAFLREYLHDYDIKVELKRYKRGVERQNEIPREARDHVSPSSGTDVPPSSPPVPEQTQVSPDPAVPAPGAGEAPGNDQDSPSEPSAGDADGSAVLPGSDPGDAQ